MKIKTSQMGREACVPCRDRKVRCDVAVRSQQPCSQCVQHAREAECWVPPRQKRVIRRRAHQTRRVQDEVSAPQTPLTPDFSIPPLHDETATPGSEGEIIYTAGSHLGRDQSYAHSFSEIPQTETTPTSANVSMPRPILDSEDHVLQQVCEQIATPHCDGRMHYSRAGSWATVIEYQNALQATGILGELLARYQKPNRVIQIHQNGSGGHRTPHTRRELELRGLDQEEIAFLTAKNAFHLPSRDVCKELFAHFFTYAHPYTPVLDRGTFLVQYDTAAASTFVMQAVLVCAVPYASNDLLQRAGFATHQEALREFNKRASLLYSFNCEKQQLSILQGALLLGAQWMSHTGDKDYRFWMSTAIQIAMRMGLHRSHIQQELEPKFYALLKRIWCVLWVRDVLLVTTGLINERRIPDDCDTVELCEADWDESLNGVPDDLRAILPYVTTTQKLFHIHLSRLAVIGRQAHKIILSQSYSLLDHNSAETVLSSIRTWRRDLPSQLVTTLVTSWPTEGVWALILAAWASRIECHIHRTMWTSLNRNENRASPASPGLRDSIFNLDSVVKRAVLHDLCRVLPLTVTTSAAVNVAVAIELLCQPDTSIGERAIYEGAVRNGILFLRRVEETWATVTALLSLFAWVLARKGLNFTSGLEAKDGLDPLLEEGAVQSGVFTELDSADLSRDDQIANALLFSNDPFFNLETWDGAGLLSTL